MKNNESRATSPYIKNERLSRHKKLWDEALFAFFWYYEFFYLLVTFMISIPTETLIPELYSKRICCLKTSLTNP